MSKPFKSLFLNVHILPTYEVIKSVPKNPDKVASPKTTTKIAKLKPA